MNNFFSSLLRIFFYLFLFFSNMTDSFLKKYRNIIWNEFLLLNFTDEEIKNKSIDDIINYYEHNKKNNKIFTSFIDLYNYYPLENLYGKELEHTYITFIIPTIGRKTLNRTLESLISLKNKYWKAVVVMDGIDVDKINDSRIVYTKINKKGEKNYGGMVRNYALQYPYTSDWIGFLDDDDTISENYIDYLIEECNNNDVIIFRMAYENGTILPGFFDKKITMNRIGISFAMSKKIASNHYFQNHPKEDYLFLKELEKHKYSIIISSYVAYFVRTNPFPISTKFPKIQII